MGAPKTVQVPKEIEGPFAKAEEIVSKYFGECRQDPAEGTIQIFGERYVLVRAASLSVEFFRLVYELYGVGRERDAEEFAHNILFDLAHSIGKSDARNFHAKMGLTEPIDRLSAGPVHFAHAGWAKVEILPESKPQPNEGFFLVYDHPYSFEADAWAGAGIRTDFPACVMNAGYSSGWCEESFGVELVAAEVECRARGDARCRFVMAHPRKLEEFAAPWVRRGGPADRAAPVRVPDFFARKRVEEELRRARDELEARVAERTAQLEESSRRLAQAQRLESVGRLAGGIAHDFNNLMAVIIGNAGLATKGLARGDPARALLAEISAAGERAAALTRQLLAFSRAQPRAPEVLDLDAIAGDLARMFERLIGENIRLEMHLGGVGLVEADRAQMEQVVLNLVVNARDAMPDGGEIVVGTSEEDVPEARALELGVPPGRFVALSVADTGTGMSDEVAAHAFDPFFTTKDAGRGTGLGLSTVYGVAKQSGGAVVFDTEVGRGTRFTVLLPRVADRPREAPAPRANGGPPRGGRETVLVAEDQAPLRQVIGKILRDAGYSVLEATSSEDAVRIACDGAAPVDLLLTDVVMPGMNGPQLALRLLGERPKLRVLYMSGYPGDAFSPALLLKPFSPDALLGRVRQVLDDDGH